MDWRERVRAQLLDITGDPVRDDDIVEELAQHLASRCEDLRAAGVSESEAMAQAERELRAHPHLARLLREADETRPLPPPAPPIPSVFTLSGVRQDVGYALRLLRLQPAFAAIVLVTIALGIGANTAVFSVVNSVLIEPLAYPDADELVAIAHVAPGAPGLGEVSGRLRLSPSMYFTYAEENRVFTHVGIWFARNVAITGNGDPEQVRSVIVSDGTLQALGVQPQLGRWLSKEDQQVDGRAAVLAYGYWQRRFGGDPNIVGKQITVDSSARDIVGVMPAGFRVANVETDLILPARFDRSRLILPGFGFEAVARLRPGVTIAEADADVARMIPIWRNGWPPAPGANRQVYEQWRIGPALRSLKEEVLGGAGDALWIVMGTVAIVMLIACANVANLLLVRADGRQRELAVRTALGAERWRIARGLLVESVSLAMIGSALGLVLAYAGLHVLVRLGPSSLPRLDEIAIDARALVFAFALSLLSGLLFGIVTAVRHADPRIMQSLHAGGRTSSHGRERLRARGMLVVVQVALALVLLVGSGLMLRTLHAMLIVDPGFTVPEALQIMRIVIPPTLVAEPERVTRLQHDIVEGLQRIPGVTSAAFSTAMPMEGVVPNWDGIRAEGQTYVDGEFPPLRLFKSVSPGFFTTVGTRLIAGREFTWTDLYDRRRVAILSENLARELWGTPATAIGKKIGLGARSINREVIGVVQNVYDNGVHEVAPPTVYWPAMMEGVGPAPRTIAARTVTMVARSAQAGTQWFLQQTQQAVWSANKSLPVAGVRTMQEVFEASLARTSFTLILVGIAASIAFVLGVIGIYGAVAYNVAQRRREIGIRLALGESHRELRRSFVRDGLVLAGLGVAIGLGAAVALAQVMGSLLFDISPLDPLTYGAVAVLLTAAATMASYLPARRASSVDPVDILTAE